MSGGPALSGDDLRAWRRHAHGSPLYRHLAELVASDDGLLDVINRVEHRPRPNMLFGAVHFLLMRGGGSPLREFYPSLVEEPAPVDQVDDEFRRFVAEHEEEIVDIGRTRYIQTNECKRCAALLPAVWATGLERFHLLEIGASAGLNLAMDAYMYRWGDVEWGPPSSPVLLDAGSRGGRVRPAPIEIITRTGIDLDPIDPASPDDRAWLTALIWPEHRERRERLQRALDVAASLPIEMLAGSALDGLPEVLESLPPGDPVIVVNSMTLIQMTRAGREAFYDIVSHARNTRPVHRVSFEILATGDEWVTISVDSGAGPAQIGQAHPHGEWVELYARP